MNYQQWEQGLDDAFKADVLWKMTVYRYALFLAEICWCDVTKLQKDSRTLSVSDQLYRSVGSISANIAEGYSKSSAKDRARFYEYSLGSAREGRDWYYKSHHILGDVVTKHRINLITEIIRLLLTIIPHERGRTIQEEQASYNATSQYLFDNIPLP